MIIPEATKKGYAIANDGDGVYVNRPHQKRGTVQKNLIQTLTTQCGDNLCVVVKENIEPKVIGGIGEKKSILRIRKLTPKECFRLMGVKDEDFEKIRKNQSDASLYHLAGDSIVVDVMYYMFEKLFDLKRG